MLIRRAVDWAPGFHCADADIQFDRLFLFHLRYHDRASALMRLARTRAMPWADLSAGAHQRVADDVFATMLDGFACMDREACTLDPEDAPLAGWLDAVRASRTGREGETHTVDLHLNSYRLWSLPARFIGRF